VWASDILGPLSIPYEFLDERLSTKQAMRTIHESGGKDLGKLHRDAMAAQIILQSYLDLKRPETQAS
jgi:RNase H-fold protein (predicted Holliday junction resolvase)